MGPDPRARGKCNQARPGLAAAASAPALAVALLIAAASVAGCSRGDPIEQARLLAGRAPTSTLPPVPGAGEPYPNLGSVPPRPETTPPAARQALANALVADRANARYIGQPVSPALPRGRVAEPPQTPSPPLGQGTGGLLGARDDDGLPMTSPPAAPPPIAGAPGPAREPPPSAPASAPLPAAGGIERAPIGAVVMEPLPPPPAMPSELPPRARRSQPGQSSDPSPPHGFSTLPGEGGPTPREQSEAERPSPPASGAVAQRGSREDSLGLAPAPALSAQPTQPAVVVDRTALEPSARRSLPETGYALAFLPGSATIVSADLAVLSSLVGRGRGAIFQVTGFADDGASGRALELPLARAQAVADALRSAGVPPEQIELGGAARPGPAGRGAEVRLVYTR